VAVFGPEVHRGRDPSERRVAFHTGEPHLAVVGFEYREGPWQPAGPAGLRLVLERDGVADAELTAGAMAVIRATSILPSGRRSVRGLSRSLAATSFGRASRPSESTPAVMPRMVCSGSPPEGSAAARAPTGPEVSWWARCARAARSLAVARAPAQLLAEIREPSVCASARTWLSWPRANSAVAASHIVRPEAAGDRLTSSRSRSVCADVAWGPRC